MKKDYVAALFETLSGSEKLKNFKVEKKENFLKLEKENFQYEISYNPGEKLAVLSAGGKKLSSWSLDGETVSNKDVDLICEDFLEILTHEDKKQKKALKQHSEEEKNNVNITFFINRMITFFPNLKEEVQNERKNQENFRIVRFIRSFVLPEIFNLLENEKEKNKINKFFSILGELYKNGNLDVRSTITMLILNAFEEEKHMSLAEKSISDELKKAWNAAKKFKNKKVNPEKIKKRKPFMAKIIESAEKQK